MKNNAIYYSIGALLYCPANKTEIADSVISEKFGTKYSLALCLEDTIKDGFVEEAENILINTINKLYTACSERDFYLPKLFIRVRNTTQITALTKKIGDAMKIVTGYIIPKFSVANANEYINQMILANEMASNSLYMMPIYESSEIIDIRKRYDVLYDLMNSLSKIEDRVLNIRVGGNDLCHQFGFRRHINESIHSIRPIANIFSDIITLYGTKYVISGPVWEYYSGEGWDLGLNAELIEDSLCGFIGKTVIHPRQIEIVNDFYKVSRSDYDDACAILNWSPSSGTYVAGSISGERMNEYKTHFNWAQKILYMADYYGIR